MRSQRFSILVWTIAFDVTLGFQTCRPAPIIDLGYARYQGFTNTTTDVSSFLGIRYADPPTGVFRWQAPMSPSKVTGVQQAIDPPPQCYQGAIGISPTNPPHDPGSLVRREVSPTTSEDCLFLNVYFPGSVVPRKPLPVVVYIHGGGYVGNSASRQNGEDLLRLSRNSVVAVLIQYRLGLFGFLAGSKVKQGGVLNAGLLDQDFALRWVQQHIRKFGGDPSKVTVWGTSAGAGSVLQHVVARDGRTTPPLFHSVITSSTYLPSQYAFNDSIPELLYSKAVNQTNCATSTDTLTCLRAADVDVLEAANVQINSDGFFGTFVTVPVVDGEFITQRVTAALKQGKVNGKALLAVTNTHEGNLFVDENTTTTVAQYATELFPGLGENDGLTAAQAYASVGTPLDQIQAIMGEALIICPTYFLLDAFSARAFKVRGCRESLLELHRPCTLRAYLRFHPEIMAKTSAIISLRTSQYSAFEYTNLASATLGEACPPSITANL
ncbi:hypothetical protein HGRIS_000810 [Hohenbuehelia grisea]|uniref:Carboxylic ester hydrolase n=1 Tax=Hohenbuehelia grisea TaxID=104357 RepID=A0ABR3IPT4_9AGAR